MLRQSGNGYLDGGALDQAVTWTKKALAIQDDQVKRRPNSVECLERVGTSHTILGQIELESIISRPREPLEAGGPISSV